MNACDFNSIIKIRKKNWTLLIILIWLTLELGLMKFMVYLLLNLCVTVDLLVCKVSSGSECAHIFKQRKILTKAILCVEEGKTVF